jgi:transcriptional/translational regulatory protein YebC/TACO1
MHAPLDEQICHEGYGPGTTAVILTCQAGREVPREPVHMLFREQGGRLGATGSVSYLFRPVGVLRVRADAVLAARAVDLGVEEVVDERGDVVDLVTDPAERSVIERELVRLGYECIARGAGWRSMQRLTATTTERRRLDELVRQLAAVEGVGHVYTNAQTTDQLLATV